MKDPSGLGDPKGLPLEPSMTTQEPRYLAYMLRLWQVRDNDEMMWRASLEDPHTGERRGFASLEMLVAFLREQTRADDSQTSEVCKTSEV
jgi:hypothetical protein